MSVETDDHGRLYLSSDLRKKYGERFHVVEYGDRIELVPVAEDPLAAVRDEVGDALADVDAEDVRSDALDRARSDAMAGLDRGRSGEVDRSE